MAISIISCKSSWLKMLSINLEIEAIKPLMIHCDNEASIKMATNLKITLKSNIL